MVVRLCSAALIAQKEIRRRQRLDFSRVGVLPGRITVQKDKLYNGGMGIGTRFGKNVMEVVNPGLSADGEGNEAWREVINRTK